MDVFRTIIVPTAEVQQARQLVEDDNMFRTALSPMGTAPATHFISSGWVPEETAALFPDASEEEPFAAMAELNLQLIGDTE